MKDLLIKNIDQYRDRLAEQRIYGISGDNQNGVFTIPYAGGKVKLSVIASNGAGWEHVSVSLKNRCPTWNEMCHIKDLFFHEEECVVQYHPPKSSYVNVHSYCLHLWKPEGNIEFMMPKEWMVG